MNEMKEDMGQSECITPIFGRSIVTFLIQN